MYSPKGFTHHHRCKREEKGNVKGINFFGFAKKQHYYTHWRKTNSRTKKLIHEQKGKREKVTENSLHEVVIVFSDGPLLTRPQHQMANTIRDSLMNDLV